jgi:hypothetical protein
MKAQPMVSAGKKHGPTIAFVAGMILSAVATIEVARATLKAEEKILQPAAEEFTAIENTVDKETEPDRYKSARKQVYIKSGGRALKLYGKALFIYSVSTILLVGGWKTQSDRLATAINFGTAAATALSAMTDNTRQTFGDEVATALRTGKDIPEAVDRLDIEKVKECAAKKIRYSDPFRSYGNDESKDIPVDYKVNTGDPIMLKYDKQHIKPSYWYKNPVNRLKFLKATEQYLNKQLESGAVTKISVKDVRDAIGYIDDDETPTDAMLGWWDDGVTHPVDFGLTYLLDILESHKLDAPDRVMNELEYVMIDDGHDCKRDWFVILNPMGNLYQRA